MFRLQWNVIILAEKTEKNKIEKCDCCPPLGDFVLFSFFLAAKLNRTICIGLCGESVLYCVLRFGINDLTNLIGYVNFRESQRIDSNSVSFSYNFRLKIDTSMNEKSVHHVDAPHGS